MTSDFPDASGDLPADGDIPEPADEAGLDDGPGLRASLEDLPDLAPFLPENIEDIEDENARP